LIRKNDKNLIVLVFFKIFFILKYIFFYFLKFIFEINTSKQSKNTKKLILKNQILTKNNHVETQF